MSTTGTGIWFFEDVDLYKIFCPHVVKDHAKANDHCFIPYKKEDFIYFEEDSAQHVYLVKSGSVKIGSYTSEGKEITKAILHKGEVFGEMVVLGEDERESFAQAMSNDTVICPLTVEEMNELMKVNKKFALRINKIIGWRRKKAERMVESLVYKNSRTRVVEYLLDLAVERGKKVGLEILITEFHTHKDIGALTATSRQTVNTVLNELKKKNLVNFDRKRILIRDFDKLKEEVKV